jgi:hypothetical protein
MPSGYLSQSFSISINQHAKNKSVSFLMIMAGWYQQKKK